MITFLKKRDRILLEMLTGMVVYGLVAWGIGCIFVHDRFFYSYSLWIGVLMAHLASVHMAKTLDKALWDSSGAAKIITTGYVVRYICVGAVLAVAGITGYMDAIAIFVGYMSLKVAAYLQPFTHKFYNAIFHETDPVATAIEDEVQPDADLPAHEEQTIN